MRKDIYIPNNEDERYRHAAAAMKTAGTSMSAEIMRLLRTSKFWPRHRPRSMAAKRERKERS